MELATVLVSAVVSVVTSLATASAVASRQWQAQEYRQARRDMRELVTPVLRAVRQHEAGHSEARPREYLGTLDAAWASKVLQASARLPLWRRAWVTKRVRRLIGPEWFELIELYAPDDYARAFDIARGRGHLSPSSSGESVVSRSLGSLHAALSGPGDAPATHAARRDLERLASSW